MDLERYNRYVNKISIARSRLEFMNMWSKDEIDIKTKFALYQVGQEVIEAITDIVSMILKDEKNGVQDDYSNIQKLEDLKILSETESKKIREANELRNRLIHHYNNLDEDLALSSLLNLYPFLEQILEVFESWINNNYSS